MLDKLFIQQFVQAVRNVLEASNVNQSPDYVDILIIENALPLIEASCIFGEVDF
jgi:hypothetical protein